MAKVGRKPIPLKLLKARGSKWARGRDETEPGLALTGADVELVPPGWLSEEARIIWDQVLTQIKPMGLLGGMDTILLARYCTTLMQWLKAKEWLETHGQVHSAKNSKGRLIMAMFPQMRIFRALGDSLLTMERELAMSPSSRASFGISLNGAREPQGNSKSRFFAD